MADTPATPTVGGSQAVANQPEDTPLGFFEAPRSVLAWQQRDASLATDQLRSKMTGSGQLDIGRVLQEAKGGWVVARDMDSGTPNYIFYDAERKEVLFIEVAKIQLGEAPNITEVQQTKMESVNGSLVVTYGSPEAGSVVRMGMNPDSKNLSTTQSILGYTGGKFQEGLISHASAVGPLLADPGVVPAELAAKLNAAPAGRTSRGDADPIKNDKTWAENIGAWMSGPNRSILVSSNNQGRLTFRLKEGNATKVQIFVTAASVRDFAVQ